MPRYRDEELLAAFGQAVRFARMRKGWSQAELAERARPAISEAQLGRIELGRIDIGLTLISRIASALGLSFGQLMEATALELRQRAAGGKLERKAERPVPAVRAKPQAKPASVAPADTRPSVAACYIVQDGRLLMVLRRFREGTLEWAGPSGNIEPGETPEQAAVREVLEEVGLAIVVEQRLGDRVHPATGRHLIYFACRVLAGEAAVHDHEEIAAVEWVPIPEALRRWDNLKGGVFAPVRAYLTAALEVKG